MRTIDELRLLLPINRNCIDDEIEKQPQLYWECSEGYTDAASKRDLSKFILDRLEADCAVNIRSNQVEKLSDKKVADAVMIHPAYIDQYEKYLGHKANAERWAAIRDAFQARSSMLRDLVTLHTTGYWGSGIANNKAATYAEKYQQHQQASKVKDG